MNPAIIIILDVTARRLHLTIIAEDAKQAESLSFLLAQTDVFGDPDRPKNPLTHFDELDRPALDTGYQIRHTGRFNTSITEGRMRQYAMQVIDSAISIGIKAWAIESGTVTR